MRVSHPRYRPSWRICGAGEISARETEVHMTGKNDAEAIAEKFREILLSAVKERDMGILNTEYVLEESLPVKELIPSTAMICSSTLFFE